MYEYVVRVDGDINVTPPHQTYYNIRYSMFFMRDEHFSSHLEKGVKGGIFLRFLIKLLSCDTSFERSTYQTNNDTQHRCHCGLSKFTSLFNFDRLPFLIDLRYTFM